MGQHRLPISTTQYISSLPYVPDTDWVQTAPRRLGARAGRPIALLPTTTWLCMGLVATPCFLSKASAGMPAWPCGVACSRWDSPVAALHLP